MPFGFIGFFHRRLSGEPDCPVHSVSNAFRLLRVFPPLRLHAKRHTIRRVSNAFRLLRGFPQMQLQMSVQVVDEKSPMPFGFFGFFHNIRPICKASNFSRVSNAFRLLRVFPRRLRTTWTPITTHSLQCLSASSGFSTGRFVPESRWGLLLSPMPFGFFGFFHRKRTGGIACKLLGSPMPFGFFGFFHQAQRGVLCGWMLKVSNAFRLLRVFPPEAG